MATIGPVELKIRLRGDDAFVDVGYEIAFDSYDQSSNQPYVELCQLIGDDTATGDLSSPGPHRDRSCRRAAHTGAARTGEGREQPGDQEDLSVFVYPKPL